MQIELTQEARQRLTRPVNGEGGFQTLLRRIQPQIHGSVLTISATDFEKLERYSFSYGGGGFQWRAEPTASAGQMALNFG